MGIDKRGIDRGFCKESTCSCMDFKLSSTHKCSGCGHLPTVHEAKTLNYGGGSASSKTSSRKGYSDVLAGRSGDCKTYPISSHYQHHSQYGSKQIYGGQRYGSYSPVGTQKSRKFCANGCGRSCYYDDELGEFNYCSVQCRDMHYLPKYKKELSEALPGGKPPADHGSLSQRPPCGPSYSSYKYSWTRQIDYLLSDATSTWLLQW